VPSNKQPGSWRSEYLAAIVDSTDDAVIGKTMDGTIISWNKGAERMYGYAAEEVIGRPISILIPTDRPDELPAIMNRLAAGQRVEHYRTERVRRDGTRITVSVTISPVRDASGVIIGASAIARDVTREHDAMRRREDFISIASHELRTPLTTLFGRLQLAERRLRADGVDRDALLRDLATVHEAADRFRTLVERLLDTSRITSGGVSLEVASADVAALVHRVVATVAEISGRRIVLTRPEGELRAMVDEVRIEEVVTNLLDNAVKYTPAPGQIEVEARVDGADVVVTVRDRGPGVAADEVERIFERFHRGTSDVPGVGLGLHIAREIVQLHGGSLTLEVPQDGGSRFMVRLPRKAPEPVAPHASVP
jgi:PAS domain S-box-containing protein